MVNIAKHIRIFNTEPSDYLVDKRTAAIAKLTAVLGKKARLPEILQLANNVAAGVIDPNKLSTALATEVEAAIKERSTAFDRDGNELEVLICLLLAMCQRLENHEAGDLGQADSQGLAGRHQLERLADQLEDEEQGQRAPDATLGGESERRGILQALLGQHPGVAPGQRQDDKCDGW